MDTVRVETASPEFDRYLDWLKYQALAERIWARRGFYQASGAFGFRDQLQDSVNLIWMDPCARPQADPPARLAAVPRRGRGPLVPPAPGRPDRVRRAGRMPRITCSGWPGGWSNTSARPATTRLLDERTPYLESELPFPPLPANKEGMGFDPLRSSREDTIYRHCLKAIDLVLDRKMGAHGLPLIGTGDWNDGLDEIGSRGPGESVWLGFFLYYILERMAPIVGRTEGRPSPGPLPRQAPRAGRGARIDLARRPLSPGDPRRRHRDRRQRLGPLGDRRPHRRLGRDGRDQPRPGPDRLRDRAERPRKGDDHPPRLAALATDDTKPYLGRSSEYPEGVRENGMYCHGVQWLVGAARLLSDRASESTAEATTPAITAKPLIDSGGRSPPCRTWKGTRSRPTAASPTSKAADMVTTFDPGRMIWHGYTGAAGWMFPSGDRRRPRLPTGRRPGHPPEPTRRLASRPRRGPRFQGPRSQPFATG